MQQRANNTLRLNFLKKATWVQSARVAFLTSATLPVGGQAVIEGVMMRSPRSMVVALRNPNGQISVKDFKWVGLGERYPILKKPLLRGMSMLVEAMINGTQALSYSAEAQMQAQEQDSSPSKATTQAAITLSLISAFAVGIFMFVVLPHLLTVGVTKLLHLQWTVANFQFHLVDGLIKTAIFLTYITAIGRLKDIRRVFQYHGAEHKSIATYEAGQPLETDKARHYSRFHPRCGTSFIITLIAASILVFSALFPLIPRPHWNVLATSLFLAMIKIPLMIPIVGLSYEFIRTMGKGSCPRWAKWLVAPGLWTQRLTTREPDDQQLEVGLASLRACLSIEELKDVQEA